jgi:ornithine cyclodeaminase/alanine dehydrogenase-like protein (mu-crystallin family)
MRLLSKRDVQTICDHLDTIQIVRDVLLLHDSGGTILPAEAYLSWTAPGNGRARSINMPAYLGGDLEAAGTKIINANPANIEAGLPRASGVTLVFNRETARIECILEGSYLSALRTALVTFLSVSHLHMAGEVRLGLIGAGYIGEQHLVVLLKQLSIARLTIFDLNITRSEQLALAMKDRFSDIDVTVSTSAEELVRTSTCIVTTTTVTEGYIDWSWIQPGSTLVNVSLDDFRREVYLKADKIFVDDWKLIIEDNNRLLGKLHREGVIFGPDRSSSTGGRCVSGTIGALLAGQTTGRQSQSDIILVNPFGMAISDIALAHMVWKEALAIGHGTNFDFD